MPRRLVQKPMRSIKAIVADASRWVHSASRGRKLMLSITAIVIIVAAVSGLVNIRTEEGDLLNSITVGADQLSRAITSATWHAMLDDHREAAYEVMQTIAEKQGIDRIRMFNRAGQLRFSTGRNERSRLEQSSPTCAMCHARGLPG